MNIFNIIDTLEKSSGCIVSAHISNNEMAVFFKYKERKVKHVFTDEEVDQFDITHWSAVGGSVRLKIKSER